MDCSMSFLLRPLLGDCPIIDTDGPMPYTVMTVRPDITKVHIRRHLSF